MHAVPGPAPERVQPAPPPATGETLRVLMVSDVYFPRVNGVSSSIMTFRRELLAQGHEVVVVAPDYGTGPDGEEGIVRAPARRLFFDHEDRLMRARGRHRLEAALAARPFDIVHIQTPFAAHGLGIRISERLGVPRVATYHTLFEEYLDYYVPLLPGRWFRGVARWVSRQQGDNVHRLVVPSRPMREALREYGVKNEIAVIPTGIELEDFARGDGARFRRQHGIAADRPVLVYVGRVAHEKNIGFLFRMLARLRRDHPDCLLVVAGEGPAEDALRHLAGELGIEANVLFVGYLARDGELQDCYRAGDAFVFASRTETQGLVLLEAMALGVPVVSTAVMGTRDVLVDGEGGLVAPEDPEGFAARVAAVLDDPELHGRLGESGRHYARRWSAPAAARQMLGFYQEVIDEYREAW